MYYDNAFRIHLKTKKDDDWARKELIKFCLEGDQQYVAIGWSFIYKEPGVKISDYQSYYDAIYKIDHSRKNGRTNPALNVFRKVEEDDLFWVRDLSGMYWICRCLGKAMTLPEIGMSVDRGIQLDIGSVVPVKAFLVGPQVPGEIKAAFNQPHSYTTQEIKDDLMTKYAKILYNKLSKENVYKDIIDEKYREDVKNNVIRNLPDFELEELVMSYLQIKYNYYLLSNSIARKSTTVKIEGIFISRDPEHPEDKAVVQVKGPKSDEHLTPDDFKAYIENGFTVFLYGPDCESYGEKAVKIIHEDELKEFYYKYRSILSTPITDIEDMILGYSVL